MLNKDHVLTSEALYISTLALSNQQIIPTHTLPIVQAIETGGGIWLGCQLPDIDTTSSKIGKYTKPVSSIIAHFGHHGITHSLFGFAVIAFLSLYMIPNFFNIQNMAFLQGIVIGYILHILEDSFSKAGVIWLFPFWPPHHKWKYNIYVRNNINLKWRYKTGGKCERVIHYIDIIIVSIGVLCYLF